MTAAATYNRTVFAGTTDEWSIVVVDADGDPVDISDKTWTCRLYADGAYVTSYTVARTDNRLNLTASVNTTNRDDVVQYRVVGTVAADDPDTVKPLLAGSIRFTHLGSEVGNQADGVTVVYTEEVVSVTVTGFMPATSTVVDAAWWTVPTGPDQLLSLRCGQATVIGQPPPYDITESCWRTYVDPGDRHGHLLFRPDTYDTTISLVSGDTPTDIEGLGGIDVSVSARAARPCLTSDTIYYLAQQAATAADKDWAVAVDRDGRLCLDWIDSTDTYHRLKWGSEGIFIPPDDRMDVRVAVIDNGDGSATGWAWRKFDHDGPWLALEPFIGPGSDFVSWSLDTAFLYPGLTDEAPDFVTRTDGPATGFGRGFLFGSMVVREPSTDPIGSPGAVIAQLDMADGVGSVQGDTFDSNGTTWTVGGDSRAVFLSDDVAGWLFSRSTGAETSDAYVTVDSPIPYTGSFTVGVRFTSTADLDQPGAAYYMSSAAVLDGETGWFIGELTSGGGHCFLGFDGTAPFGAAGFTLTRFDPHDIIAVANRDTNQLIIYVDGVAQTPVDISGMGAITNANDLTFGGAAIPTVLHGAVLVERACNAADIAALRQQWAS